MPARPTESELRRVEAATWGGKLQADGEQPPVVTSNLRRIRKNTLVGSVDLTVGRTDDETHEQFQHAALDAVHVIAGIAGQ
jgi:hypothetical protein